MQVKVTHLGQTNLLHSTINGLLLTNRFAVYSIRREFAEWWRIFTHIVSSQEAGTQMMSPWQSDPHIIDDDRISLTNFAWQPRCPANDGRQSYCALIPVRKHTFNRLPIDCAMFNYRPTFVTLSESIAFIEPTAVPACPLGARIRPILPHGMMGPV